MSTIDLDAVDAFLTASDELSFEVSAKDCHAFFRLLDSLGWHIARKPVSVIEPASMAPAEPWPPRALGTKLWATNMDPEREKIYPVFSLAELKRVTEQGASLIEASSESDARSFWESRSSHDESSFMIDGTNYRYIMDQIPF